MVSEVTRWDSMSVLLPGVERSTSVEFRANCINASIDRGVVMEIQIDANVFIEVIKCACYYSRFPPLACSLVTCFERIYASIRYSSCKRNSKWVLVLIFVRCVGISSPLPAFSPRGILISDITHFVAVERQPTLVLALDSTRPPSRAMPPPASTTAGQARNDDVEEGDDAVDDAGEDGADSIHDCH